MKLRFPLYFASTCVLSYFADSYILNWVGVLTIKSILFGLLVGLTNYLFEKIKITNKKVSVPVGVGIIAFGLLLIFYQNHFINPPHYQLQ